MRLVIVESPYAPQTQIPVGSCAGRDYGRCEHCARVAVAKRQRERELLRNVEYARAALADCLRRNEAPYASHLLYTQPGVLDDTKADERQLGIRAGFMWRRVSNATVVYTDLGISQGMRFGIEDAIKDGRIVEYRNLPGWAK